MELGVSRDYGRERLKVSIGSGQVRGASERGGISRSAVYLAALHAIAAMAHAFGFTPRGPAHVPPPVAPLAVRETAGVASSLSEPAAPALKARVPPRGRPAVGRDLPLILPPARARPAIVPRLPPSATATATSLRTTLIPPAPSSVTSSSSSPASSSPAGVAHQRRAHQRRVQDRL